MRKIALLFASAALLLSGCVEDDLYEGPASISKVEYTPGGVTPYDDVTVSATITDLRSVSSAAVIYSINGAANQSVAMTASGSKYSAVIPMQANGTVVKFHVEAINELGLTAKSDEKSYTVSSEAIDYTKLILNELNGNDKFIEIYNSGSNSICLDGVYIQKDGVTNWTGSATQFIHANEYLVLYSEDVIEAHPECEAANEIFTSGLSPKKAVRIQLFTPSGTSIGDFNLTTKVKVAAASYSRNADGVWHHAAATPGAVNNVGTDPVEGLE